MSRDSTRSSLCAVVSGLMLVACGGDPEVGLAPAEELLGTQESAMCLGTSVSTLSLLGISSWNGEAAGSGSWEVAGGANAIHLEYFVDGVSYGSEDRIGLSGDWYFSHGPIFCGAYTFLVKAHPMVLDSAGNRTYCLTTGTKWASQSFTQDCGGSMWLSAPEFTPPFHIAADGYGDLSARFVDLNGDGRQDFVHHRQANSTTVQKGAYLSTASGWQLASAFTPPALITVDGIGDAGARFVDLNGDGRQDFVFYRWRPSGTHQKGAYLNTGNGWQLASAFTPPFHIAADGYGDLGARFVDLNGDGRQDLVFHRLTDINTVQKGAYLSTASGWLSAPAFTPPALTAVHGIVDAGARFVDLNGDGRQDFVFHRQVNSTTVQKGAYLNTGSGWQLASAFTPPFHIALDGRADVGARFVDLDGDGRQDFVFHRQVNSTTVQKGAYLSTGSGWLSAPALTPPALIAVDGIEDAGARFVDLDGDGRQDFVFHRQVNSTTVQKGAYLSTGSGWQWSPELTPPRLIAEDGRADVGARFADLNGDLKQDFVFHRWLKDQGAYLAP